MYFKTCSYPKYETILFGSKGVGIHTSVYADHGSIIVCTLVVIDDNPGVVQDASVCDGNQVKNIFLGILYSFLHHYVSNVTFI